MKIDTSGIQDFLEKPSSSRCSAGKSVVNNDQDVSLRVDYASIIDAAVKSPDTDPNALYEARKLLASGKLESPQNDRAAAENIIKYGI